MKPLDANPMPATPPPEVIATRGPLPPSEIRPLSSTWRVVLKDTESVWPWSRREASVTCGVAIVGEAGYCWRSRTRAGLVAKVARSAARQAVEQGEATIHIEVVYPS